MADTQTHYQLLNIEQTATGPEINRAYRQTSRTVHPDRNPSPNAALLFHALTEAYELLKDPQKRAAYDLQLNAANAKKQRFAALDSKRKAQTADLEEREEAYKRQKEDEFVKDRQRRQDIERLKAEGAEMRKKREAAIDAAVIQSKAEVEESSGNAMDPLDATFRLKWPETLGVNTEDELRAYLFDALPTLEQQNSIDSIAISSKKSKSGDPKQPKLKTAAVALKTINSAVKIAQSVKSNVLMQDFSVTWVKGEPPISARRALGLDSVASSASPQKQIDPITPAKPKPALDESSILEKMRARQAERQRLEEEIRKSEAAEV